MTLPEIFLNQHNRVRSGWRFTIFLLSYFVAAFIFGVGSIAVLSNLPIGFSQNSLLALIVPFGIFSLISIFFGWLYGKIFEDLPFRALGCWFTKNWLKDFILGLIIGAISIGFAVLIVLISGSMSFQINDTTGSPAILLTLGVTLAIFIVGAISEETLFRGYLLQTLTRAKLFWVGTILTSFLFASAHNANPSANLLSWINTFVAGIWFAVAYFKTRNLWFPLGVHLTWNWFQGSVFGINVSGLGDLAAAPVLRANDLGPKWLSGGEYGIEGGIACTVALIISTLLIWFLPILKPTEEMLALSSEETLKSKAVAV